MGIMKNLICICLLAILSISCGSENNCTPETIPGTYVGNIECDETNDPDITLNDGPVTLNVESLGDNSYSATDEEGEALVFTADGCNVTIPDLEFEFFGIMIRTSGNGNIDGDKLDLDVITSIDGASFNCNTVVTKQ